LTGKEIEICFACDPLAELAEQALDSNRHDVQGAISGARLMRFAFSTLSRGRAGGFWGGGGHASGPPDLSGVDFEGRFCGVSGLLTS
jgi:hypothetical protein